MSEQASTELFGMIEEKGIERVTAAEAHGTPRAVFGLWMAANVEFATLTTGALATGVFGLSAEAAFLSILIANLAGSLLLAYFSTFGVEYGLPQMIQGAEWFGKLGNKLPSFFNFLTGFSWFAVNSIIGAYALQYFLGTNLIISVVALCVVQVAIAFVGHDMVQRAEKYFVYLLVLLFGILTVIALRHISIAVPANAKSMASVGGFSGAFILTTSIMIGLSVSWVPFSSDYTRYLRQEGNRPATKRAVAKYAFWGSLISTVWIECLGALIGASVSLAKPSDLFTSWMPEWFRGPLLVAVIIGTISANIINIYSATLSGLALGIKIKQHWMALLAGVLGTGISIAAAAQFITNYTNFLFLMGYWIMPWIAIMLLGHITDRKPRIGKINPGAVSFVLTLILSVPFYDQTMYTGIFAAKYPQFGDITFIVSFVIAVISYLVLTAPALVLRPVAGE